MSATSVRGQQPWPQLHIQLGVHDVTLRCSSEDLAHALRRAIEAPDFGEVHGTLAALLLDVRHKPVHARLTKRRQAHVIAVDAAEAEPDKQLPAIDDGVTRVRRQQAADDLHAFLPILITEGRAPHGLGHQIVVVAEQRLSRRRPAR